MKATMLLLLLCVTARATGPIIIPPKPRPTLTCIITAACPVRTSYTDAQLHAIYLKAIARSKQ